MKKILVFNAGSSTLKYKLFEFDRLKINEVSQGSVVNIGMQQGPQNHSHALSIIFQGIGIKIKGLSGISDLVAIGHRVVHCGDKYKKTTLIDDRVIKNLKDYNLIAPLHNPKIIEVIESIYKNSKKKEHRNILNYAVFDSVFYKDLPAVTKLYPLPYEYYTKYGIQRFGFHGISHQYVSESILSRYNNIKNLITIHLGSGCSITAIKNGKPVETSMGFTPLEGLMMLTRSGNIDSGIIHYLVERGYISHKKIDPMLNFNSGMVGVTGINTDMMNFLHIAGYKVDDPDFKPQINPKLLTKDDVRRVKLAIDMFVYRIKKFIGAYYAILGGLDCLVFTGKIGYHSSVIRNMVIDQMHHITKNAIIEAIETNEEFQIAKEIINISRQ
jgi:acetate kinase